jgi:hypothetical protein
MEAENPYMHLYDNDELAETKRPTMTCQLNNQVLLQPRFFVTMTWRPRIEVVFNGLLSIQCRSHLQKH